MTSAVGWSTRVGSFIFPGCTPAPKATIQGTITNCATSAPINLASVAATGGYGRVTTAPGTYAMTVAPGTYTVSANKPSAGFPALASQSGVTVTNGGTATVNLCLTAIPVIAATTATLVSESFMPANGAIDPGETVTFAFGVQNTGAANTVSDVGSLQATGGVTAPVASQNYGVVVAGGAAVSRNFTFTASPALSCGDNITATVAHLDGASSLGSVSYTLPTGAVGAATTISYTGPSVAIPDNVAAGVNIVLPVSGVVGSITDLNFRFDSLAGCSTAALNTNASVTHTFPGDLRFKLTSPSGTTVNLITNRGGSGDNFCTILLDDDSAFPPASTMPSTGAVAGNFAPESALSAFDGQNANGNWTLNVSDTAGADTGTLNRFSLIITGRTCAAPPALVAVAVTGNGSSTVGASVTFTATLSGGVSPTGSVAFKAGGTNITGCAAQPVASSVATCTTNALPVGNASITAVYAGDINNATATSPAVMHVVTQAAPSVAVTGNGTTTVGTSVTFTATVIGGVSPTGSINFKAGATTITGCGAQTLASNVATCTTSALAVGSTSITAVYAGDINNATATSPAVTHTVNQAAPSLAVSGNGTTTVGASVTFTATLSGGVSATGSINFRSGATTITGCGAQTVASNVATCATSALPVGNASITAVYAGDINNTTATSPAVTHTVALAVPSVAVTGNGTTTVGASVTFTATLSSGVAPTGSINFRSGATTITGCGAQPVAGNVASCTTSALAVGSASITAVYPGDINNATATSPAVTHVVNKSPTTTTVSSSLNPSVVGNAVTFTANVTGLSPTGTINFKAAGATLTGCGAVVLSPASAICTTTFATVGSRVIAADYSGDANNAISTGTLAGDQAVNAPTITIAPTTLPNGGLNTAYGPIAITATGGTSPYNFAVTAGTLPAGVTLAANGSLGGTPTATGSFNFTITATDANNFTASRAYPLVISAVAPGAPTGVVATPGDGIASVSFSAPAFNGGSAITSYTATCGTQSATSVALSITVSGLTNGVAVTCTVTAANAISSSVPSTASNSVTPVALTLLGVQSRKPHGAAGNFDVPVDTTQPITGIVSVEPRTIGSGHVIVFQFDAAINSTGTVTAVNGSGNPLTFSAAAVGNTVVVTLPNVPENSRATVSLTGVNGGAVSIPASIGFLIGDVNNTRSVSASDVSGVKARSGQPTTGLNFRFDVNATGAISASDISAVKARSGLVLP